MKNRPLAICLVGCVVLLFFSLFVPLPLVAGPPADQRLSQSLTLSGAAHTLPGTNPMTSTFYLPLITRQLPRELHGYVTENGVPASGITVTLFKKFPHPYYSIWLGSTTTDSNGYYNFTGIPALACDPNDGPFYCWGYYIDYSSAPSPDRLMFWETVPITEYVQGAARQFATFDIGAPVLLFPNEGDVVSPTMTFTWVPRPFPADNYEVVIGPDAGVWFYNLGYTNAYTATLVGDNCNGRSCSNLYNTPLHWRIWIHTGEKYAVAYGYTYPTGVFTITAP